MDSKASVHGRNRLVSDTPPSLSSPRPSLSRSAPRETPYTPNLRAPRWCIKVKNSGVYGVSLRPLSLSGDGGDGRDGRGLHAHLVPLSPPSDGASAQSLYSSFAVPLSVPRPSLALFGCPPAAHKNICSSTCPSLCTAPSAICLLNPRRYKVREGRWSIREGRRRTAKDGETHR